MWLTKCGASIRDILLSVDANSAYTFDDREHLKKLDDFNLLMIEQPLQNDDLMDHARLQETDEDADFVSTKASSVSDRRSWPSSWTVVE